MRRRDWGGGRLNVQKKRYGLGLAIVRKIVGLHLGEVGARNVPEGFQVWVRLPAATQA
jgi:signal transduction histidine kinase